MRRPTDHGVEVWRQSVFVWWLDHQWVPLRVLAFVTRVVAWLRTEVRYYGRRCGYLWQRARLRAQGFPRTWQQEAERRGARYDADGSMSMDEYDRVGIAIINGCPGCQATVAPYNSYFIAPDNPYTWCSDCAGIEAHGGGGLIKVWVALPLLLLGCAGCFADGKELLAPPDPRYTEMCPGVYEDYVCQEATVSITIANPLCGISIVCEPADTLP